MRTQIISLLTVMVAWTTASGQWVLNGDLDDLEPGLLPDCGDPAGAWGWPANYMGVNACESVSNQFEIVPTSMFEMGATGNSLHHNVDLEGGQENTTIHLVNLFQAAIHENEHPLVIAEFDIWVAEAGTAGGGVYLGGDHGGGGFSGLSDRGPFMVWKADGVLRHPGLACPGGTPYPVMVWQRLRLEIDLAADRWDLWWAERGDPLVKLGSGLTFVNQVELDHLDRFTYVHFASGGNCPPVGVSTHSYLDNLKVSTCLPDTNLDGTVDVDDLVSVIIAWGGDDPAADINNDGDVDVDDLLEVILAWDVCGP
jgi:hypothetical protein